MLLKAFDNLDNDLIKIFPHCEVLLKDWLLDHASLLFWSSSTLSWWWLVQWETGKIYWHKSVPIFSFQGNWPEWASYLWVIFLHSAACLGVLYHSSLSLLFHPIQIHGYYLTLTNSLQLIHMLNSVNGSVNVSSRFTLHYSCRKEKFPISF